MSNWLAGIIGVVIGSALGILMISIVSVTRQVEQENSIYREGFAEGHRIGLRKGKALQRADTEAKTDQTDNHNRQGCPYCSWIDPERLEEDEVDGPQNYCRVCGRDLRR